MAKAIVEARAKINWALGITGRRRDGYHTLDMLVQSVSLSDAIEIEAADTVRLVCEGGPPGPENLAYAAAEAYRQQTGCGGRLTIIKRIPMQAGLGGGSADAAGVLRGLNALYGAMEEDALRALGGRLGADVPFLLTGGLARVRGVGERIEGLPGRRFDLVLAKPDGGVSTAEAYRLYDALGGDAPDIDAVAAGLAEGCVRGLGNALRRAALRLCPAIEDVEQALRRLGAKAVGMSGSGSAVFGVFASAEQARQAAAGLNVWSVAAHSTTEGCTVRLEA